MHSTLFYVQRVHYNPVYFFLCRFGQYSGNGLSFHGASKYHSDTAHAIGSLQASYQARRTLPDYTQLPQESDIHALVGYSNPNLSKRKDADRPPQGSSCHLYNQYSWRFAANSNVKLYRYNRHTKRLSFWCVKSFIQSNQKYCRFDYKWIYILLKKDKSWKKGIWVKLVLSIWSLF
jgi:hypothetical protein